MHNRLQHIVHALPRLRADGNRIGRIQPNCHLDRFLRPDNVGRWQIDLVDHRNDLQPMIDRKIRIGQRLRLHALARIHHQQRALARRQ